MPRVAFQFPVAVLAQHSAQCPDSAIPAVWRFVKFRGLSALQVFFGVRSYRDNVGAGRITFGRAFAVGILITLISSACYVGTWEILYFKFMPDFVDKYAANMVEHAKASGATQQKVDETARQAQQFKKMYANPAINVALTFMEVFPIGLVVTAVSAGILRKKVVVPK